MMLGYMCVRRFTSAVHTFKLRLYHVFFRGKMHLQKTAQDLPKAAKQKTLAQLLWCHPPLVNGPGKNCQSQTITGLYPTTPSLLPLPHPLPPLLRLGNQKCRLAVFSFRNYLRVFRRYFCSCLSSF